MTSRTEASLTWAQALGWRLGRHFLDPVGAGTAADVVRRLGAVLAMDESLADLAVRTRQQTSGPDDLADALAAGEVVMTFAFRGSMHLLSARDGGTYLALRAAGRQWELPSWVEHYGLAPQDWPDFRAAVRAALDTGPLTIGELGEVVTRNRAYRHLAPTFADGAGTLVKPLAWQGDLSFGPVREGRRTFQRLDGHPLWQGIPDLDEAGPAAILAYLRTYGPATTAHVDYWLGAGLSAGTKRLRSWWAGLGDGIVPVDVGGTVAWVAREDVADLTAAAPSSSVRLLPGHDQWVIGPGTKDEHVTPPDRRGSMTRKANPVVVGGVVRGTWTWRRDEPEPTVDWADDLPRPTAALDAEVARLRDLRDVRS